MPTTYYPHEDHNLEPYVVNLAAVMLANLTAFGISQAQYDALDGFLAKFQTKLAAHVTAQAAAKAATEAKNLARTDLIDCFTELVNLIQAKKDVPNELKDAAGIPVHDKIPTEIIPVPPTELTAESFTNKKNGLNWKNGGNKPGTLYVIEAKIGEATSFSFVDVITATKYEHTDRTVGVKAIYRVRAKRGNKISDPSNEAAVYSD